MSDSVPTDSVLRRHYEAANKKEPVNQTPQTPPENQGGFGAWLKKVFGC